ncbi:MAG: hypothetical protein IJW30_04635 [Clostridia bacterium]|nr:hypothetical protein [Clostridia bacterium]
MSESEKKRRLAYRQSRKRRLLLQGAAMVLVAVVILFSFITYRQLDKATYIEYTEQGNTNYRVYLKENDFFDAPYVDAGGSYIPELIDYIPIDFLYQMKMDASGVDYRYSYSVDAKLEIIDGKTNRPIYEPVEALIEKKAFTKTDSDQFKITESVLVDYESYNEKALEIINEYGLPYTESNLVVTMHVNVIGNCKDFQEDSVHNYTLSLQIPLAVDTVNISTVSTQPDSEGTILACSNTALRNVFKGISIAGACVEIVLLALFFAYAYLTRNHDIIYSSKIKKLLSSYKSYIQVILTPFDTEGYQILEVDSFDAMLNIRDTIQSPILMHENSDRTRAQFFVPTATKILYLFDIKVEDYDELYPPAEEEPVAEEIPVEEPAEIPVTLAEEPVIEEPAQELPTPAPKEPAVAKKPKKEKKSKKKRRAPWSLFLGTAVFVGSATATFLASKKGKK